MLITPLDRLVAKFLAQHDLVYDLSPAWLSGIPLGNGDIGALLWGDGHPLKVTLDKYDAWELRSTRPDDPRYSYNGLRKLIAERNFDEAKRIFERGGTAEYKKSEIYPTRLPMPRVELDFGSRASFFSARLKLYDAVAKGRLWMPAGTVNWESFVSSSNNVFAIRLRYEGKARLQNLRITLSHLNKEALSKLESWGYAVSERGDGDSGWLSQSRSDWGYAVIWRVEHEKKIDTLYVTIVTGKPKELVDIGKQNLKAISWNYLLKRHIAWWHKYWDRSFICLPDPKLENLFYVEMYKLGCCSRPGKYPISLQGIWTEDGVLPPWSGDYHLDMNVQESYWPIYASNRLELGFPLYERFFKNLPRFEKMCKEFFGFEGAWSRCEMGLDGAPIYGYYTTNFWPGNGAWLAHHYWLHYLYSMDEQFLKERAYPFMRAFMKTYLNLFELGEDGKYHLPLSNSPEWEENMPGAWGRDTTCDLALARFLAQALIETCRILKLDDPDIPRWKELLEKIADYPQDENGLQIFRGQRLTHSHRHHSHLMPIHPLGILNIEGSEMEKKLIDRSIDELVKHGTSEWTGWSFPWASLIASRAGRPHMAWRLLQDYFFFISENSFHINGDPRRSGASLFTYTPMTLEAGFCAAAAEMEMLLQSWGEKIRLFPSIPSFWHDAYFHGLRTEGGFVVTSKLRDGKVIYVKITSEAGRICNVVNPFGEDVMLTKLGKATKRKLSGQILTFNTKMGETYLLTSKGAKLKRRELEPTLSRWPEKEQHWFGCKAKRRF